MSGAIRSEKGPALRKSSRAGGLLASAEQVVPPFLLVGGLRLVLGRNHPQPGAVDGDLGLDAARPGTLPSSLITGAEWDAKRLILGPECQAGGKSCGLESRRFRCAVERS